MIVEMMTAMIENRGENSTCYEILVYDLLLENSGVSHMRNCGDGENS